MTPDKIRAVLSGAARQNWDGLPEAEREKLTQLVANNLGEDARGLDLISVVPEIAWHARRGGVR
jgi:hypothetical protein